jgi:hypothetical protein
VRTAAFVRAGRSSREKTAGPVTEKAKLYLAFVSIAHLILKYLAQKHEVKLLYPALPRRMKNLKNTSVSIVRL